jgi:hypothetical protein
MMKKNLGLFFLLSLFIFTNLSAISQSQKVGENKFIPDSVKKNPTTLKDSTITKPKLVFKPLKVSSILNKSLRVMTLLKNTLETIDYRTTADFFTNIPFGFVRDLGSLGQPNEVLIFGQGYGKISFLDDGVSINNRFSNSLDLNLVQSESIDSIEVIPIARGFLYGSTNNQVAVNIISREPNFKRPYSKIKFYQAPNSEGLIDAIFCLNPFRKFNAYFEITNQSTNTYYQNSDYGVWIGNIRLRYLLAEKINILANYRYYNSKTELNGGVDVDSISSVYPASQIEQIIYDKFRAPVRYSDRHQEVTGHSFNLRMLGNFIENSPTDFSFYYQTNLDEFRQNETGTLLNTKSIIDDNKTRAVGANLRQDFSLSFAKITSITNFEKTTYNSPLLAEEAVKSFFSTAALAEFSLLDKSFFPILFGKYLNDNVNSYIGLGADFMAEINSSFKFFGGISSFEKPRTIWEERFVLSSINLSKQKITSIEFAGSFDIPSLRATIGYFNQSSNNALLSAISKSNSAKNDEVIYYAMKDLSLHGINLKIGFKIWKFLLTANTSYYPSEANRHDYNLPEITSQGGVYFVDTLFNDNLKLKTGINYYSVGHRDYSIIDFEKNISTNYSYDLTSRNASLISATQTVSKTQFDFFLSGRIKKSAIVYFAFENLFNEQYYIVPFYPKQVRGIRFGLAWEFLD